MTTVTREAVLQALDKLAVPGGGSLVSRDMVRALSIEGDLVRFVIEAEDPALARDLPALREAAEAALGALPGVGRTRVMVAAPEPAVAAGSHAPAQARQTSPLKLGGHPGPDTGSIRPAGVDRIIAVGSGKGGVGKSTVAANLAVALARQGRRVGLLDADIYGPSQPRMMGVTGRPSSPDGKTILPLHAHGVTVMSIGLMLPNDGKAVVWRGPMLMKTLQQMLGQVAWGELDVLIVDLPPGTGDVQLTLCQRAQPTGAIVVSTPQDVAMLDARKALDAFRTLKTPVLGLIENMASYLCPNCGHESHPFGTGGVRAEAEKLGLPLLGTLPLSIAVRESGDGGLPVAAGDGPESDAYAQIAARLIAGGMA